MTIRKILTRWLRAAVLVVVADLPGGLPTGLRGRLAAVARSEPRRHLG